MKFKRVSRRDFLNFLYLTRQERTVCTPKKGGVLIDGYFRGVVMGKKYINKRHTKEWYFLAFSEMKDLEEKDGILERLV